MMSRPDAIRTIIAVEVSNSNHGDFLKHIAAAWQHTDRQNKRIMRPFWTLLIEKYELEKEYAEAIEEHLPEYLEAS